MVDRDLFRFWNTALFSRYQHFADSAACNEVMHFAIARKIAS